MPGIFYKPLAGIPALIWVVNITGVKAQGEACELCERRPPTGVRLSSQPFGLLWIEDDFEGRPTKQDLQTV